MYLYAFLITFLAIALTALYHRYNRTTRLMNKIPGPKGWPIIGNSLKLLLPPDKLFAYQRSLLKKYGELSQIHGLGLRVVYLTNPDDIEKILSSNELIHKEFPYIYATKWLEQGLLTSSGSKWFQRRKMLTKTFHFSILKKFTKSFIDETDEFMKRLEKEVGKEQTDVRKIISNMTLRILCGLYTTTNLSLGLVLSGVHLDMFYIVDKNSYDTAMGFSDLNNMQSLIDSYLDGLQILRNCLVTRFSNAWLLYKPIYECTNIAKEENQAVSKLHQFTDTVIRNRRIDFKDNVTSDTEGNYEINEKFAMLDLLLQNEKKGLINNDGIREEVNTFMFAGHDTTSVAMAYMMMALANEPNIQDKIYAEMQQIFGDSDRSPTSQDLSDMKYLECCIKESLRLYPSAPLIMRHLHKETVLSGYTIPAETTCCICIYDVHRRADLYPEPKRFIPERFLPENSNTRHPFSYIPFSAGSRNCIGQKFALLEMKVVMSALIRKFRLEPVTKTSEVIFKFDLVLLTQSPVYVKFCLRK